VRRAVLVMACCLALGLSLFAQGPGGPPPGGPPPGSGQPPRMQYDSSKEVTLQGTVTSVQVATRGPGAFVTLAFLVNGTTYQVMAGPQSLYLAQQMVITKGDTLTLVGVVQTGGPGGSMFMARTLTKGDTVVTLLDSDGQPVHS